MQQKNQGEAEFKVPVYQRSTGQQVNSAGGGNYGNQYQQKPTDYLRNINFELAELYFPIFVIQIRFDIFPLRNRQFRNNYNMQQGYGNQNNQSALAGQDPEDANDDLIAFQEFMKVQYENTCKIFFILRDFYLLTKVAVTGTVVFHIKKDEKHFIGIDDTTGVLTCVLWLNDFSNQTGQSGRRQEFFRTWLSENNIGIGDTLSILGVLEYFQDKIQLNIHKLRLIRDSNEEMLQFQQTLMAQRVYFDPYKSYEKRLFGKGAQTAGQNQVPLQQPDYVTAAQRKEREDGIGSIERNDEMGGLIQHSTKRIKKKIIDYILNNYNTLFFVDQQKPKNGEDQRTLSAQEILSNIKLIQKVEEELRLGMDKDKKPKELLQECLTELEEKGFLNCLEQKADEYIYQIRDQRDKLKHFITEQLRTSHNGLMFDSIYRKVCQNYDNFYTKDFVFKVIDELFQMGLIYEIAKQHFGFMDNQLM